MKTLLPIAIAILLLCSCHDNKTNGLSGKWKLTEELIDIGDGKGTFQPTDTDQVIEFLADGTFTATTSLCQTPGPDSGQGSGTYSTETMELTPTNCAGESRSLPFELKGGALILRLPCIEPCQQKYERIEE